MKTFRVWIRQFEGDDNPMGDLSQDIKNDREFPKINDYDEILSYLRIKNACFACIQTFQKAWKDYEELS